jgi:hypothetical protein
MRLDREQIEVADDRIAAVLREKTPMERVALSLQAGRLVRRVIAAGLRDRHPEWSEEEVQRETARRILHGSG